MAAESGGGKSAPSASPTSIGDGDSYLLAHSAHSDEYRSFPISSLTAGAVAMSGETLGLLLHADQFWSMDKENEPEAVRGRFHVLFVPLIGGDDRVYGVVQVCVDLSANCNASRIASKNCTRAWLS